MRILQVGSGMMHWAGTEKYVCELSESLLQRGHEVAVACSDGSSLESRCAERGVSRVRLVMRRPMDWPQLASFVRAMRCKYDVVHIHGYRDYVIPALAARLARIPAVVMTRHLPHAFRSPLRAKLCSCVFYDRIIAVSEFVKDVLLGSGVPAQRVTVVHNGVAMPVATPADATLRAEFGIPSDAFLVGAAGRIEPRKGFDVLVRAMRRVDGHCLIFGDGGRPGLCELVNRLGICGRVHLPGFRQDVARLWASADVVVVPSTWPDCFPYVAVEALAAGRPVVASRIGGIPEACGDDCAVLVTPGNDAELASALCGLAASRERRTMMGAAGLVRARRFSLERMVEGVEQVYGSLLDGRTAR
ncbi:MAG: glycosyltransferase family 4 protein [Thermoguttaceae bacterium]